MKPNLKTFLTMAVLAGALTFPLATLQAAQAPAAPGQAQVKGERHPMIRAAIRALERAKEEMKAAAHDYGGHRVEALEACDRAIEQLRKALEFDKK